MTDTSKPSAQPDTAHPEPSHPETAQPGIAQPGIAPPPVAAARPAVDMSYDPGPGEDESGQKAPALPIALRAARTTDAGKLGAMISQSVDAQSWMPKLHSGAQDVAFAGKMIDRGWVTVAEIDWTVSGFMARDGEEIHSLYIADFAQNQGVGQALIADAKTRSDRLSLWTFQANRGAQRFYKREGFEPVEETDGSGNDEGLPDIRFEWTSTGAASDTAPGNPDASQTSVDAQPNATAPEDTPDQRGAT